MFCGSTLLTFFFFFFFFNFCSRYVTGSLVFGVLYDKLNKLVLLAISTFGFAVFQCAQPWCVMFPVMLVDRFFGGAFAGGLDTGKRISLVLIYTKCLF